MYLECINRCMPCLVLVEGTHKGGSEKGPGVPLRSGVRKDPWGTVSWADLLGVNGLASPNKELSPKVR